VKLIPAQFVRPFVKSNKNDFLDAEAIAEAVDRQIMRFVPIKTDDQLDLQAIHRVRDRLIARRTSVINQLRAFLLERGMTFAKTPFKLKVAMPDILENAEANLTPRMRNLVSLLWSEWKDLEQQIVGMNQEIEQIASSDPACRRLRQIPGIRPAGGNRDRGCDRQRRSLPQGPRVLLLAGACAAAALDWGEGKAIRHQQAREQIPPQAPRARRPIRCPPGQARAIPVRSMARCAGDPSADQRGGHSGSQQAGSHRLGRSIKRPRLSRSGKLRGCLRRCGKDAFGLEALIALPLYRTTTTTRSSPTKVCTG
jgi:Transposase